MSRTNTLAVLKAVCAKSTALINLLNQRVLRYLNVFARYIHRLMAPYTDLHLRDTKP
jgi:hypothetical protein